MSHQQDNAIVRPPISKQTAYKYSDLTNHLSTIVGTCGTRASPTHSPGVEKGPQKSKLYPDTTANPKLQHEKQPCSYDIAREAGRAGLSSWSCQSLPI